MKCEICGVDTGMSDGSKGVLKCPAKTIALMSKLGELICDELKKEASEKKT